MRVIESEPVGVCGGAGLWRQRMFAWCLTRFNQKYEQFIANRKQQLFAALNGTVLEIGAGAGANLRHLPGNGVRWIGIEPNPFMRKYLHQEASRLGLKIEIRDGTADDLQLPDASVDAVISTLVLCCVPDQQRTLQEIVRVLKPGGAFVFIEHVAAPRGTGRRRVQDWVTPLWRRLGDGCRPNRETWRELEGAGFGTLNFERFDAPIPIASPQIAGTGRK